MTPRRVAPAKRLRGEIAVPGDKSISHRAAIFNAIADGEAIVHNFLSGDDCLSTLRVLRALGVACDLEEAGAAPALRIAGAGMRGLREPDDVLDCGNSGTTMRLMTGLLAAQPFFSALTGDASLRTRPMARVIDPLREMGARIDARDGGRLAPIAVRGGGLRGIRYRMPVASAQVKSAVLLAALHAGGETVVEEPEPTRDHTERMLEAMGARIRREGDAISIQPASALQPA
ncbi:MAG TPA: 3-phosphoshikimate 1-carboxyvinyltransferase, partial [Dehalococcoidia bacterium]|nr:3-phosphoshikimate 1-carboxyvinyltransferase [Dehalococcoidia bacterium]